MNGPLCGLIHQKFFRSPMTGWGFMNWMWVWESICLTVKIQLLSLPIIPVLFLNCEVAHTSFSLNLWTLHNSIWLWLPDNKCFVYLSTFSLYLECLQNSVTFGEKFNLVNWIWWHWIMRGFGGVFGSGVWEERAEAYLHVFVTNISHDWLRDSW